MSAMLETPEAWATMIASTGRPFGDGGAYMSDGFADWAGCANLLRERGYTVEQAEVILRSKHMRWCSDGWNGDYGAATVAHFAAYLDRNGSSVDSLCERKRELVPAATIESAVDYAWRMYPRTYGNRVVAIEAIRADRDAISGALASCFVPGDDVATAENVRHILATLRSAK